MADKPRVYIDGQVGTTGLRIVELLAARQDLTLLAIDEQHRKDATARAELLNSADISILCLPDDAAREAVRLIENPKARVIDSSTAHRVAGGWVYGLPELLPGQRSAIASAKRVSNPGCYPTCVALLLRPLLDAGCLWADAPISIHALSGYSGGGRSLIEKWESSEHGLFELTYEAPYALERLHKHLPEMHAYTGLSAAPYFVPAVGPFHSGMRVQIPLHAALLQGGGERVFQTLRDRYQGERFISVSRITDALAERELDPTVCNGSNRVVLHVLPHPDGHVLLCAILDNLGKGASGAAVQNLNLMLGLAEEAGL